MSEPRGWSTCVTEDGRHKHTYPNRATAVASARRRATRMGGAILEPYRCKHGKWVLGHGPKAKKRTA